MVMEVVYDEWFATFSYVGGVGIGLHTAIRLDQHHEHFALENVEGNQVLHTAFLVWVEKSNPFGHCTDAKR
ncbi:RNA-directed DNA polymerase (reverse transcriptase) [Quillaja saponaria]|uniref:RNA-directed DNA polymerase (Reverse transcriptase) n=1 Tax=Quillaja saponaria TaxID=32244 RepID=A0AAD7PZR1_QUISA|nr:RNA-directed DNA polymerase (reverse transcriptase) [Quillaja saponaria]